MKLRRYQGSKLHSFFMSACVVALSLAGVTPAILDAQTTIAYVQGNSSVPQSSQSTVSALFSAAQSAGNLNVVVVGWNDSVATIKSVTDTKGNSYTLAVGPTVQTGTATQAIYFAKNIAAATANSNRVTVTFNGTAAYVDLRFGEYKGLDTVSPFDVAIAAMGNSTTSNSGSVTTTIANDLLVGANLVQTSTIGPGASFTSRIITSPDGDILEDQIVTATGSYSATAPLGAAGAWIMQMVAFKAAGSAPAPPDLTLTKTHTGSFIVGQTGQYTLTVKNSGGTSTSGQVTLTDTLPTGLTATVFAGTGWTCTLTPLSCSRTDSLGAGASYPSVTLTVNVSATAPASVTNTATVSGGGETNTANDTANDVTSIVTPDTQPPSAPGTLTGTAASGTEIDLSWGAATDNVGVTAYHVERCQGAGCSTFAEIASAVTATSFSDTGLAISTTYSYRVRAQDAVGNLGPYSNVATATTLATNPHLLAAYAFNEGSGTVLTDLSGNGNNGTISNGSWTTSGKFGGALSFNGTSTIVTVPDKTAFHLTTGMTLEAWVNPTAVSTAWRDVIYKATDNYYLEATTTTGAGVPAIGQTIGTSTISEVYAPGPLTLNTWTHLAATYDGATLRLYVNGTQVGSRAQTGSMLTSTNALTLGGDSVYGQYFAGLIDEIRIYDVALTATAIQTDMNTSIGNLTPDLTLTKTHAGAFSPGQVGAQYTLTVTNSGQGATTGTVTVTDSLPAALQATGISGTGWTCTLSTLTCTRSDSLAAGASYPSLTLTVNVSSTAPSSVTNVATVSGGGETNTTNDSASDVTSIAAPDTQPPSAPGTLTATAISGVEIDLAWGAATDNVGVAGYRVERCQGAGCSTFTKIGTTVTGTTFNDTGLTPNTSYSYIVRAQDAAGNLGPYTNVASATTLATNPHLLAAYSFNEGSGTALTDLSGNGNTGTIANGSWTTSGKYGAALSFNGTSTMVTIPDKTAFHLSTGMTLEAWVNPNTVSNAWRDVIYKGNDNYYLDGTTTAGGVPVIGQTIGTTYSEVYASTTLTLNSWTHLAATYDGATLRLYINAIEAGNRAQTGAMNSSTNALQIGGDTFYGQFFSGLIDEVRIYDIALKPTDIQADMNSPLGNTNLPLVTLSTSSVDMGSQPVGTTSNPTTVTLTNTGGGILSIASIGITGPQASDFHQTNTCGSSVAVGATCNISITYTPAVVGTSTGSVTITDNAPGSPHTISLTGTGTGFSISPRQTILLPGQQQQFTASGPGSSSVTWLVDNIAGGSVAAGTISTTGLYTAPGSVGNHTVSGRNSQSVTSSATAYIVNSAGIFTQHFDNSRTGANTNETILTPSNVNYSSFGKLNSYPTDGVSHASPLYVAGVNIPNVGVRNVVYVATEHDSVYAFDADGSGTSPLWQRSFINPAAGITTVPNTDTGECCDIAPEIGITGTPVIDPATGTLYVVAKTKENGSYVQRLHALDITTGAEKLGGPVVIQATVTGSGLGSSGNQLPFDALRENQRTGLLLLNGIVYFGFGSHGDNEPYHGWVFAYNATTLAKVFAYCTTRNGEGGGVWHSGGGLVADASGNLYFITGDGTFDADTGGLDYGDTYIKMSPSGALLDYFTPHDQGVDNTNNLDLGAGGMNLLPDQPGSHPHMLVSGGKNGSVYLVDRDSMGHYSASADTNVQTLANIFPFGTPLPGNYSSPVYFNGTVYFGPIADSVQSFRLSNGLLPTSPTSRTVAAYAYPGASMSVSANGTTNAILWATEKKGSGPGTLHAYDPNNLQVQFYNSDQAGSRDALDTVAKFTVPLAVNGKLFVLTEGHLFVFGLLP